jgi:hypothetical protein
LLFHSQQQETNLTQQITDLDKKLLAMRSSLEQSVDELHQLAAKSTDDELKSRVTADSVC